MTVTSTLRRPAAATLVFAAAAVGAGLFVLAMNQGISFFFDDWEFLLERRGFSADAFLEPHNEHISILPVTVYKLVIAAFGMDSNRPFQVVAVLILLSAITTAYLYIRRHVGPWLALSFVAPVAVSGPGWDNVLWPFQIGFTGALAAGLGAMLLLEAEEARRDAWACALLFVSVSFSSLGLAFFVASSVLLAVGRPRWRSRAWVVAAPALYYAAWWIGWGHHADTFLSWTNLTHSPAFVFDGFAASLASWFGLATVAGDGGIDTLTVGRPLLTALLVALALWLLVRRRLPREVWPPLALGLSFWLLIAVNANPFRLPTTGRYLLTGALFLALTAATLLRGIRPKRAVVALAVAVAAASVAGNVDALLIGRDVLREQSELERAGFTAVELARDRVDPEFVPTTAPSDESAGEYLAAVDADGSPGYGERELAAAPEPIRAVLDQNLASALGVALTPATRSAAGCETEDLGGGLVRTLAPPATLLIVAHQSELGIALRRYARESFPAPLGTAPRGVGLVLDLPPDRSNRPWQVELSGAGSVLLCPLRGS